MEGVFGGLVLLIWLASIVAIFWVHSDASQRYPESSIGCLWALMVLALGPIAIIAYFLVRPPVPAELPMSDRPHVTPTRECPSCGTKNRWNMQFCRSCGKEVRYRPSASGTGAITCPSCHERVPRGRFCSRCGESLGDIDP